MLVKSNEHLLKDSCHIRSRKFSVISNNLYCLNSYSYLELKSWLHRMHSTLYSILFSTTTRFLYLFSVSVALLYAHINLKWNRNCQRSSLTVDALIYFPLSENFPIKYIVGIIKFNQLWFCFHHISILLSFRVRKILLFIFFIYYYLVVGDKNFIGA